jgi:N-acylneuraminate cytidylyltransferase
VSHEVTAIVPIKEHSERLPRKNFRDFNGRPLYHWILETLESVDAIDTIVVNTDAEEVIETAPDLFDVEISVRPERFRDDEVTTNIMQYEVERSEADVFLQTYCTNPLLTAETISDALSEFLAHPEHDSLLPVTPHTMWFYDADMNPINHDPHDLERTQDMEPVYEDNGALYIYTAETMEKTGHRIGESPLVYEIDEIEATDIDVKTEFTLAECLQEQRAAGEL